MNILQVVPFFAPVHGGSAVVPYHLSRELANRGHEVTIYAGDYRLSPEWVESLPDVRVITFSTWSTRANLYPTPGIMRAASRELHNFDLVHLHNYRTFQNVALHHYAKRHGVPYLLQPHGSTPRVLQRRAFKWLFDKAFGYRIFADANKVVAVSKEEAAYDAQMGIGPEKVTVIYNGMDVESFRDLPPYGQFKAKYNLEGPIVLYLGRINKSKGIDFLVKGFSGLSDRAMQTTLVVAGPDDGYKSELERLTRQLGLADRVRFVGYIDESDKLSAYVDADIFIHTVKYMGGVALTPLEAVLCNTPVIVTPEAGEVVAEAGCGYTVEYGDERALSDRISELLEDPNLGAQMVERGQAYILENLSWDRVVDRYIEVYEQAIGN